MSSHGKCPIATSANGAPLGDIENSLTAGPRGPLLMQDFELVDQMQVFNRERIPERTVFAGGCGAYGAFKVTNDITKFTKASLFAQVGRVTPVLMRFSSFCAKAGTADAERDTKGFSVRFFTDEGNWDLVGSNSPVFFVRDPYKFFGCAHSLKRHPQRHVIDPKTMWDFWSLSPEAMHQITILHGDRGVPLTFRHMNGFGCHAFAFYNDNNERVWVKFHFKTQQGIKNLIPEEAKRLIGRDRDCHKRDLMDAIAQKKYPRWTLYIQVMSEDQVARVRFNPFDSTKVWPHSEFPLIEVGVLELNRNIVNYFSEAEQVAFNPAHMVPGIGPSPDKMLQARLVAYQDAHFHRLGVNFRQLPINQPLVAVHRYTQEGHLWIPEAEKIHLPNYFPNSSEAAPRPDPRFKEKPELLEETTIDRFSGREYTDDYSQAGALFRLMGQDERQRLVSTIAATLALCDRRVIERQLHHFYRVDQDYGRGVEHAIQQFMSAGPMKQQTQDRQGNAMMAELAIKGIVPEGMGVRE